MKKISFLVFLIFSTTITFAQSAATPDSSELKQFEKVDVEASFPDGEMGWRKFLERNLNPNVPVDNGAPVGRYTVYVQFIVDKDGSISDVKALTKVGYGMEKEVIGLLKKSGAWSPALVEGKPVKAYRKQPVTFAVTQEDLDIISEVPYTLFAGIDNEITIDVDKLKDEDVKLVLSRGTITKKGDGKYIIRVTGLTRVTLEVFGKKNKKIADVSFNVVKKDS